MCLQDGLLPVTVKYVHLQSVLLPVTVKYVYLQDGLLPVTVKYVYLQDCLKRWIAWYLEAQSWALAPGQQSLFIFISSPPNLSLP